MFRRLIIAGSVLIVLAWLAGYGLSRLGGSGDEDDRRLVGGPAAPPSSPSPSSSAPASSGIGGTPGPAPARTAVTPRSSWTGPKGSMAAVDAAHVALTFDDGPNAVWTPKVLKLLRHYHVKATFCLIGTEVKANPELVAEIAAEGHTLCNHAWHHEMGLGSRSRATIEKNLMRTNEAIAAAGGGDVRYYRQPGGKWTKRVISVAEDLGMTPLHWSVDPSDWDKSTSSRSISTNVLHNTGPGSIILMHDGGSDRSNSFRALETILPKLVEEYDLTALP